jgi:hypothetical protein
MLEAETRYLAVKAWWASSKCTSEEGLEHLQFWLAFWYFRYRLIIFPSSPRLRNGLPPLHQQNKCRWWHYHELWMRPYWRSPWFHILDSVALSCCSPNLHLLNQFTNSEWVSCPIIISRPSRIWYQSLAVNKICSCIVNTSISYLSRSLM